jgi:large repetitive protein
LRIKGTDVTGATVDRMAMVAADGTVSGRLLPGSYQVEVPAVPLLQNGQRAQMINVVRTAESLSSVTEVIQPTVGRLRPEFLSIQDFLGSTSRQSVLIAAVPGANTSIVIPTAAVSNVTGLTGTLDTNARTLTLKGNSVATTGSTGTVTPAAPVESVIPVATDRRVQSRGSVDSMRVYRVNLNPSATTFAPVTPTTPATSTTPSMQTTSPTASPAAARALSSDQVMADGLLIDDIDEERNVVSPASTDEAIESEFGRE